MSVFPKYAYYGEIVDAQRPEPSPFTAKWFAAIAVCTTALTTLGVMLSSPNQVAAAVENFVVPAVQPMVPAASANMPQYGAPQRPPMTLHAGGMIDAGALRKGQTIDLDGVPHKCIFFEASKQARQAAVIRTKLVNLVTGNNLERTFKSNDKLEKAAIEYTSVTFTYIDEGVYVFTNMETFEEDRLPAALLGDNIAYLTEGMDVKVAKYDGRAIDMQLPINIDTPILETEPGEQGDRANAGSKPAVVAGGKVIQVPLFVNVGDMVRINTEEDRYVTRV